jgi:hypothetical protein
MQSTKTIKEVIKIYNNLAEKIIAHPVMQRFIKMPIFFEKSDSCGDNTVCKIVQSEGSVIYIDNVEDYGSFEMNRFYDTINEELEAISDDKRNQSNTKFKSVKDLPYDVKEIIEIAIKKALNTSLGLRALDNAIDAIEMIQNLLFKETFSTLHYCPTLISQANNTDIFKVAILIRLILNDIARIMYHEEKQPIGITQEMLGVTLLNPQLLSEKPLYFLAIHNNDDWQEYCLKNKLRQTKDFVYIIDEDTLQAVKNPLSQITLSNIEWAIDQNDTSRYIKIYRQNSALPFTYYSNISKKTYHLTIVKRLREGISEAIKNLDVQLQDRIKKLVQDKLQAVNPVPDEDAEDMIQASQFTPQTMMTTPHSNPAAQERIQPLQQRQEMTPQVISPHEGHYSESIAKIDNQKNALLIDKDKDKDKDNDNDIWISICDHYKIQNFTGKVQILTKAEVNRLEQDGKYSDLLQHLKDFQIPFVSIENFNVTQYELPDAAAQSRFLDAAAEHYPSIHDILQAYIVDLNAATQTPEETSLKLEDTQTPTLTMKPSMTSIMSQSAPVTECLLIKSDHENDIFKLFFPHATETVLIITEQKLKDLEFEITLNKLIDFLNESGLQWYYIKDFKVEKYDKINEADLDGVLLEELEGHGELQKSLIRFQNEIEQGKFNKKEEEKQSTNWVQYSKHNQNNFSHRR